MRHIEVPRVEAPERFFPEPVLLEGPIYRVNEDGTAEFYNPRIQKWRSIHPIFISVLQGLEEGLDFATLTERLPTFPEQHINRKAAAKLARKFCWQLHEQGIVRYDLEDPPAIFNGRYERVKELGRGGLGIAHLCRDLHEGDRLVVIKHPWGIKAPIMSGQRALAMEIAVMQDVQHPLIPTLHDQFTDRGLLHIVRDFVDGEKMQSRSVREAMRDPATRNRHIGQICEGLHEVHQAGYIFFDPSPDNFFLVGEQVVTADVGGCRTFDGTTLKSGGRGTPGYVARELRDTQHPSAGLASVRSDIWSIGCLYYYYVVGERPKRAWFHDEIMASLDGLDLREADRAIIDICTRDDPAERPSDMLALADLLE